MGTLVLLYCGKAKMPMEDLKVHPGGASAFDGYRQLLASQYRLITLPFSSSFIFHLTLNILTGGFSSFLSSNIAGSKSQDVLRTQPRSLQWL